MSAASTRLVVVSNRLPVALSRDEQGRWRVSPGSGGLVTALAPVLKNRGGAWIGWSGAETDEDTSALFTAFSREAGYDLHPLTLSADEITGYYHGFSNEIVWPLFHDLPSRCSFNPAYWRSYLEVNLRFAEAAAARTEPGDFLWVHDYHLMYLGHFLKKRGIERKTGFFLHIPFPSPDIFLKLPWRTEVLAALLEYDLVGFQTMRDRRNFVLCLRALLPQVRVEGRGSMATAQYDGRNIRLGVVPISIDFNEFAGLAARSDVQANSRKLREDFKDRGIILGVDRLDYTKGIPQRIEALDVAFRLFPELVGKLVFIQIIVPSREEVEEYRNLKQEIERLVGNLSGRYGASGWNPVHYQYRSMSRPELVSLYLAADMALVTPLRDGMNLVAKEYCACDVTEKGVLILSEFAGAAAQLQRHGVLLVNPHDVEGMARAIRTAFFQEERERRAVMRPMRESIRRHDIHQWVDTFLLAALSRRLADFPSVGTVDFA